MFFQILNLYMKNLFKRFHIEKKGTRSGLSCYLTKANNIAGSV